MVDTRCARGGLSGALLVVSAGECCPGWLCAKGGRLDRDCGRRGDGGACRGIHPAEHGRRQEGLSSYPPPREVLDGFDHGFFAMPGLEIEPSGVVSSVEKTSTG